MSVHELHAAPSLDELITARLEQLLADAVRNAFAGVAGGGVERTHLTVAEAATAMGCSRNHLYKMIDDEALPAVRLGSKILVPLAALRSLGLPAP